MKIEDKLEELYEKTMYLRGLTFQCDDYKIAQGIIKKQNEFYDKYKFYKNYLKARNKLYEEGKSQGDSNKKATL